MNIKQLPILALIATADTQDLFECFNSKPSRVFSEAIDAFRQQQNFEDPIGGDLRYWFRGQAQNHTFDIISVRKIPFPELTRISRSIGALGPPDRRPTAAGMHAS